MSLLQLKLKRADERLNALKRQLERFGKRNPVVIGTKLDFQSGWHTCYIRYAKPFPAGIAIPVGESLYHGRSVLEHLVWALVEANSETPGRVHEFPLLSAPATPRKGESGTEAFIRTNGGGKLVGVDPGAVAIIERLQPYNRGNDPNYVLTALNEMAIDDRHHAMHAARVALGDPRNIRDLGVEPPKGVTITEWEPLFKAGDRLVADTKLARFRVSRYRRYAQMGMKTNLPVDVAFGDRRVLLGDFRAINAELRKLVRLFEEFL